VGIAVAVGDAVSEARAVAHWQLSTPGGRGAVREMAEKLLKARGQWELVLQKYE
jgi:3-deoxy-D-manno-octulosonate 8-phosphate phosphatase (KDO 8-P phosphatase)